MKKVLLRGKDQSCTEASISTEINEQTQEVKEVLDFHHISNHEYNYIPPVSISTISVSTQTDNFLMTSSPIKSTEPSTLLGTSKTSLTTNETKDSTLDETINDETEYNPSENENLSEEEDIIIIIII